MKELDKQGNGKNKKGDSSKQQSGQAKKGMDSHRSNAQNSTSQYGDMSDEKNCKG